MEIYMAKVSNVKWSQKWRFVKGSAIYGIPKYFKHCRFQFNFNILGWAEKRDFPPQKFKLETTLQ